MGSYDPPNHELSDHRMTLPLQHVICIRMLWLSCGVVELWNSRLQRVTCQAYDLSMLPRPKHNKKFSRPWLDESTAMLLWTCFERWIFWPKSTGQVTWHLLKWSSSSLDPWWLEQSGSRISDSSDEAQHHLDWYDDIASWCWWHLVTPELALLWQLNLASLVWACRLNQILPSLSYGCTQQWYEMIWVQW